MKAALKHILGVRLERPQLTLPLLALIILEIGVMLALIDTGTFLLMIYLAALLLLIAITITIYRTLHAAYRRLRVRWTL